MRTALTLGALLALAGCFIMRPSSGGGQHLKSGPRELDPDDVAVPAGYRVSVVATGLTFPAGLAFDDQGQLYAIESGYSYGEDFAEPRLLRVEADGRTTVVATGKDAPWTGVSFGHGAFFVSEGGQKTGGRILRIAPDGSSKVLVDGLPSLGDHHTDRPVPGPDGWVYFGQGTATNAGVVGRDDGDFGWLKRHPGFHDVPCADVTLAGHNYESESPLEPGKRVSTGAYSPYGTPTQANQVVRGQVPCTGAVMRVRAEGGAAELVAWGFRNPFGLAFAPDGTLYATDNGYDARGSRPVFGAPDLLWAVKPGAWYGWPDYVAGRSITEQRYQPPHDPHPEALLARPVGEVPQPAAHLPVHSSSDGLDFSRCERFGHAGEAFIAEFGDMAPTAGKVLTPVGFKVVRVDPRTGVVTDFALNRAKGSGPASRVGGGGLERPVDVRFDPSGEALYVADFGVMAVGDKPMPREGTGVIWKIEREGGAR